MSEALDELGVLVLMPTYNHSRYIEKAISSVLYQETNFPIELIISDDASTDETLSIINSLKSTTSVKVQLYVQQFNIGPIENGIFLRDIAQKHRFRYVTILEGDDYWIDTKKLQKQVDFLENNLKFSICFHRVYTIDETMNISNDNLNNLEVEADFTIEDLAKGNFMHTSSVVFRNFTPIPNWFRDIKVCDYPLFMLSASSGEIHYLPDFMAVYRVHAGGIWSSINQKNRLLHWVEMLQYLMKEFSDSISINTLLRKQYSKHCFNLSVLFLEESNSEEFEKYMAHAIEADSASAKLYYNELSRLLQVEKQIQSSYLLRLARAIDVRVRKLRVFHK